MIPLADAEFEQGYSDGTDTLIAWIGSRDTKPSQPPTLRKLRGILPGTGANADYREGFIEGIKDHTRPDGWPNMLAAFW